MDSAPWSQRRQWALAVPLVALAGLGCVNLEPPDFTQRCTGPAPCPERAVEAGAPEAGTGSAADASAMDVVSSVDQARPPPDVGMGTVDAAQDMGPFVAPDVAGDPRPDAAPPDAAPPDLPPLPVQRANGTMCVAPSDCMSGFCVVGVCCDVACAGTCQSCAVTGSLGICRPVPAGEDPHNVCLAGATFTCGLDGTCDGAGGCRRHPMGTVCGGTASCAAGTEISAATCDGQGVCRPAATRPCAPYSCASVACETSCANQAACNPGYACVGTRCQTLTTDLVGHWKLDEPNTGGQVIDSSTFANHGSYSTMKPTPSPATPAVKFADPYCLSFAGDGGYVIVPQSGRYAWTRTASFTITAWAFVAALPNGWAAVISNEPAAPNYCGIWINPTNQWSFEANQTTGVTLAATTGWHHVAIVQDAANNRRSIYVDGAVGAGTAPAEDCNTSSPWHIGATDVGDYWNGRIDDVRMYGRALAPAEIAALAAGQ